MGKKRQQTRPSGGDLRVTFHPATHPDPPVSPTETDLAGKTHRERVQVARRFQEWAETQSFTEAYLQQLQEAPTAPKSGDVWGKPQYVVSTPEVGTLYHVELQLDEAGTGYHYWFGIPADARKVVLLHVFADNPLKRLLGTSAPQRKAIRRWTKLKSA
ncbi:MAG: hypothetical protein AAFX05_11695 [Planctomycetota bacterium]